MSKLWRCSCYVATEAPKLQKAYGRFSWMESVLSLDLPQLQTLQQVVVDALEMIEVVDAL